MNTDNALMLVCIFLAFVGTIAIVVDELADRRKLAQVRADVEARDRETAKETPVSKVDR